MYFLWLKTKHNHYSMHAVRWYGWIVIMPGIPFGTSTWMLRTRSDCVKHYITNGNTSIWLFGTFARKRPNERTNSEKKRRRLQTKRQKGMLFLKCLYWCSWNIGMRENFRDSLFFSFFQCKCSIVRFILYCCTEILLPFWNLIPFWTFLKCQSAMLLLFAIGFICLLPVHITFLSVAHTNIIAHFACFTGFPFTNIFHWIAICFARRKKKKVRKKNQSKVFVYPHQQNCLIQHTVSSRK